MKIIMIAGNGGSGGLTGYIKGIISADVVPQECEVVLYCGSLLAKRLERIANNIKVIETDYAVERGKDVVTNRPLPKPLIQMIRNEHPDIILFLNGYIRAGLETYPNIMVLHNQLYVDDYLLIRQGITKLTLQLLAFRHAVRRSMKKADGVIFLSEFSKQQTDDSRVNYKNGKVIPFGFEDKNRSDSIIGKHNKGKIKIIYISALFPYKNHIELIKACAFLKEEGYNFELQIVGQKRNPTYKKLKKVINQNNMNDLINFTDWVEHDQIKSLIDQSDIFVYASSTETTGYGLLEGMARGALIAASNKAGFPNMLKDGGVYFNPKDSNSIKNALIELICMEEDEQKQLRIMALENSKHYSWTKAAHDHYKYIKELLYIRKKETM